MIVFPGRELNFLESFPKQIAVSSQVRETSCMSGFLGPLSPVCQVHSQGQGLAGSLFIFRESQARFEGGLCAHVCTHTQVLLPWGQNVSLEANVHLLWPSVTSLLMESDVPGQ